MKEPLVSVGVLCYNTGKFVIESLDCILRQNYSNIEILVIDDCSTDGESVEILKKWIEENKQENISIYHNFRKKNLGVHAGLEEILENAKGKYLSFISDDLWVDNKLQHQVTKLEKLGDEYALYFGDIITIDEEGNVLPEEFQQRKIPTNVSNFCGDLFESCVDNYWFWLQACTIRLDLLRQMNFKFNKKFISEDWHMILELSRNYKICGDNEVMAYYRIRSNSLREVYWNEEKMNYVLLSQGKMLSSLINNKKNSDKDELLIIKKIVGILRGYKKRSLSERQKLLHLFVKILMKSKKKHYLISNRNLFIK